MVEVNLLDIMDLIIKEKRSLGASYLSSKLNISQATLGRKLMQLEKLGYLKKESNRGRVLTEKGITYYKTERQSEKAISEMKDFAGMIRQNESKRLLEVVEIRKSLECLAAELACKNITDDQIKELDETMLSYAVEVRHGGDAKEMDLKLHLQIAQFSCNESLAQIIKLLLTTNNAYSEFSIISYNLGYKTLSVRQRDAIVNAIKNRDCEKAKQTMYEHLDQVSKEIKQRNIKI